jgi:pyruvate kinase
VNGEVRVVSGRAGSSENNAEQDLLLAITPNIVTGRKLSAVWGVHCVVAEDARDQDDMVVRGGSIAFRDGFAKAGQRVIIVAGVPLGTPGTTNMVRIEDHRFKSYPRNHLKLRKPSPAKLWFAPR